MKRVFIIHGWDGNPEEGWFPWIKKQLEAKGFKVFVPAMPDTEAPKIGEWVSKIKEIVGMPDKDSFFIGHSIGCQAILRYLESINAEVGGCVLVAGWFHLKTEAIEEEGEESVEVARPWVETPIDFNKVRNNCPRLLAFFSTDDPFVPIEDAGLFEEKLGAKITVFKNKGHLGHDVDIYEFPEVIDALEEMQ